MKEAAAAGKGPPKFDLEKLHNIATSGQSEMVSPPLTPEPKTKSKAKKKEAESKSKAAAKVASKMKATSNASFFLLAAAIWAPFGAEGSFAGSWPGGLTGGGVISGLSGGGVLLAGSDFLRPQPA